MKISELIASLKHVQDGHGDIEAQLQDKPKPGEIIQGYMDFFIVPEEYEGGEVVCNIRTWPY